MDKKFLDVKEIAKYLNCSESCIRKLKTEGKIPYFRVESKILFNKEMIDDWIYKNQVIAINGNKEGVEVRTYE